MRLAAFAFTAVTSLLIAACAERAPASELDDDVDVDHPRHDDDGGNDSDPDGQPAPATTWHCLGAAGDDGSNTILRVAIEIGSDGEARATSSHGPQFRRHGLRELDPNEAPPQTVHDVDVHVGSADDGVGFAGVTIAVALTPGPQRGLATATVRFADDDDVSHTLDCFDAPTLRAALPAHYDSAVGGCVDVGGEPARNAIPIAVIRETGFGHCADVTAPLNANDFGYPLFTGWDLRGANLNGSGLFFANLIEARLEGAVLDAFPFGYAEITGTIDDVTAPPEGCTVDDDRIACRQ